MLEQRCALDVTRRDFEGRHVERLKKVGAGDIEGRGKEVDAELFRVALQIPVLGGAEFKELAMLTVGGAKAVLVIVGFLVRRAGKQPTVVALLQLDRVGSSQLGLTEQFPCLLDAALMVVTDFRDHIARGVVADLMRSNPERPWQIVSPRHAQPAEAAPRVDPTRSRSARSRVPHDRSARPARSPAADRKR